MRLKRLRVKNLLSFDDTTIDFFDKITFIVGPNNSGKTNIIRILRYVVYIITRNRTYVEPYYLLHDPNNPNYEIEIDLTLDEEELEIIEQLLRMYAKYKFTSNAPPIGSWLIEQKIDNSEERKRIVRGFIQEQFIKQLPKISEIFKKVTLIIKSDDPLRYPDITIKILNRSLGTLLMTDHQIFKTVESPRTNLFAGFFDHLKDLYPKFYEDVVKYVEKRRSFPYVTKF